MLRQGLAAPLSCSSVKLSCELSESIWHAAVFEEAITITRCKHTKVQAYKGWSHIAWSCIQ